MRATALRKAGVTSALTLALTAAVPTVTAHAADNAPSTTTTTSATSTTLTTSATTATSLSRAVATARRPEPLRRVVTAALTGPSGEAVPSGDLPHWHLRSAEDFTGSALPAGWGAYSGQPGGQPNGEWKESHVVVGNGVMTLAGYRDGAKFVTGGVMAYGANVGKQTYGKYEVRFRMAQGHGIKYAVLLWPESERWPIDGEIDFAEDGGTDRRSTTATLHYGADNSQIQKDLTADFSQWNTLGVEWSPGKLVYTLNGRPWSTLTGAMVPHTAMNLAIQTEANTCGTWAGATCPNSTTPAHVDMQVDWTATYSYVA